MKKLFLTTTAILFAAISAFAQAQIGLRAGANWATIDDGTDAPDGVERPWRPGIMLGLASSFHLTENFAIAPELIYSQRGFIEEGTSITDGEIFDTENRYNFIELPVLFRLSFGDVLKGYVNAGPTFSYFLGGKENDIDVSFDDLDEENRLEIGGSIGAGVQLDTEAGSFLIDLRYTRGFTDAYKDISTNRENFKHQLISTSLIFLVPSLR